MKAQAICNFKPLQKWNWINSFFLILTFGVTLLLTPKVSFASDAVFRLHLSSEPTQLDPQKQRSSSASYLLGNLYRNLLKFDDKNGLLPDLAKSCVQKNLTLIECTLKDNLKWSDGSELTSQDFYNVYSFILDSKNSITYADILFDIKGAEKFYKNEPTKLGIKIPQKNKIIFELETPNPEFIYNLANINLSVSKKNLYSGPYKLKEWQKGKKVRITANEFFPDAHPNRPDVEFLFIEEDSVALQLYEKNELQLLRRLPTLFIRSFKNRSDFYSIPVTRFDYLGFNPKMRENIKLRKTLAYALKYPELQKIFSSFGLPGCAGMPAEYFENNQIPCISYDFEAAKQNFEPSFSELKIPLVYSSLGGDDHRRATEWMQSQWKKVGLNIIPTSRENKLFTAELQKNPPDIFRKGIGLERPSCLSAIEVFTKNHPENYIKLNDSEYEKIITRYKNTQNTLEHKKYCTQAVRYLIDNFYIIPMGGYDFSMLIKSDYIGWRFNHLNQLDLSQLHASK